MAGFSEYDSEIKGVTLVDDAEETDLPVSARLPEDSSLVFRVEAAASILLSCLFFLLSWSATTFDGMRIRSATSSNVGALPEDMFPSRSGRVSWDAPIDPTEGDESEGKATEGDASDDPTGGVCGVA